MPGKASSQRATSPAGSGHSAFASFACWVRRSRMQGKSSRGGGATGGAGSGSAGVAGSGSAGSPSSGKSRPLVPGAGACRDAAALSAGGDTEGGVRGGAGGDEGGGEEGGAAVGPSRGQVDPSVGPPPHSSTVGFTG